MTMQMRTMGPAAGWRWMMQGINLGRHNPRAIFGAAALLIAVAMIPSALQLVVQYGLKMTSPSVMYALVGFSLLYSVLVMAPMLGGFLRVIDAGENGRETHATAIFDVFKSGQGAGRMIALAVLLFLIASVVFGLIVGVFGPGIVGWYAEVMAISQSGAMAGTGPKPAMPAPPDGFGTVVVLGVLFGLFVQGAYAISFGQVSLTQRSVGGALADGFIGALKNLLPLLVLLLIWIAFAFALLLVMTLLVMLLTLIGGVVHPALGVALAAPVYVAFILIIYVVVIGVMYHLWRDVAGGAPTDGSGGDSVVAA